MADFQFKQFGIEQDRCAMKVGTDGVLLGAWARGGKRILDVGAGTGLISLMMAQRFPDAQVVGIDIDSDACQQARQNVLGSPFAERVQIVACPLQHFGDGVVGDVDGSRGGAGCFDAIVSNPPFFVDGLKNPDSKRALARHTDSLPFSDLFRGVKRLLSEEGEFSAIVPAEVVERFESEAYILGFYLVRKCGVKTVARKQPKRFLLAFAKHRRGALENSVETMMDADGNRSPWYAKITEDFYV